MPNIQILGNPTNPLHYLSCCGIFEVAARFDPQATAFWRCEAPVAFCITTKLSEESITECLKNCCCAAHAWTSVKMPEQDAVYSINASFHLNETSVSIAFDWWQETLDIAGDIDRKSAWKMYAGQQTAEKIIADMNAECAVLASSLPEPLTLTSLLSSNKGMTGRFGFDPRSSRSALDVGYSPNDIGQPVATYPFAELLATLGIQNFFPSRCGIPGRLNSSRGWPPQDKASTTAFHYRLWTEPLPVILARAAAILRVISPGLRMAAPRATRKNYSNLTMAKPA